MGKINFKDLKLVYYGNPILDQKTEKITEFDEELEKLCSFMIKKNYEYDGIAIAANQLNFLKRIVALAPIKPFNKNICLINPEIISYSEKMSVFEEGCLSFPGIYLKIKRPVSIVVEYQLLSGRKYQMEATGLLARVLQHEIDHLNGITFIRRIDEKTFKKIQHRLDEIAKRFN